MNHTDFFKALKQNEIAPVYLFVGEEGYVLKSALKQLENAVVPLDMQNVNLSVLPSESDGAKIAESCETFPFFSEKRMVVVEESAFISSKATPEKEEHFFEYLKNPLPSTVLVVTCAAPDKRKKAYKLLSEHTVVEFNGLSDAELMGWIEKTLRSFNLAIDRNALLFLLEYADARPEALICELEKLASYKKEGTVNKDDILKIITPSSDYNIFNMTDALLRKDKKTALSLLSYMITQREEPILILGAISKQFRQILMVKTMLDEKIPSKEIISTLKLKDFVFRKYESICSKQTQSALNKAVELCYKTDEGLKTGLSFDVAALHALVLQLSTIS